MEILTVKKAGRPKLSGTWADRHPGEQAATVWLPPDLLARLPPPGRARAEKIREILREVLIPN